MGYVVHWSCPNQPPSFCASLSRPKLAVAFQRTMYRRMREGKGDTVSLTQDRIRRLEDIGFEWSVRGSKLSPWELRFNDLVNFRVSACRTKAPIAAFQICHRLMMLR
jgi:hypothetical protein